MFRIFIDGREGTTGLEIQQRLTGRPELELLEIDGEKRKDPEERQRLMAQADLVFLCLPDAAAREAEALFPAEGTKVIDASTAHRTAEGWAYGFPELSPEHRQAVARSRFVANPGCHASGFISSVYPLRKLGVLPADAPPPCYSLTGYSGGGKKMIAAYEDPERDPRMGSCRIYGLDQTHKHLAEMTKICGLTEPPLFSPVVGDYYRGMATTVLLENRRLGGVTARRVRELLAEWYEGQTFVQVAPFGGDEPVVYADTLADTNRLRLIVCGNESRTTVTALFDNLGKGASGAAVQNMNIMLGLDETAGLV
ncbi:MAG: N-acetyl-gamma-glutamyl-phosphate reductase [Oscillospiraceae bacterium]|nr:N-acetyl-gamma-glutamyl-phosphate reductase [Oscillospiraceae bacterium]